MRINRLITLPAAPANCRKRCWQLSSGKFIQDFPESNRFPLYPSHTRPCSPFTILFRRLRKRYLSNVEKKHMRHVNRRENHRVEIQLPCYVTSPAGRSRGAMHIENISRTGLLMAWRSPTGSISLPAIGQIVTVEVELPANHSFSPKCIHCQGSVARLALEDRECPRVAVRLNYMDFRDFPGNAAAQAPPPASANSWMA